MTPLVVIRRREDAQIMEQLPSPVRSLTLAEIDEQKDRVFDELEHGGAIRVGVLTRQRALLGWTTLTSPN